MSRIWIPGGGGGADLDVVTASAENILSGKVIVDKAENPLTGTMPDNTGTALTVATNGKTLIPKGYHDGTQYATNTQATMAGGTKTPTTSQQTIVCNGKLMTSNIIIPAFTMPAASVIKKGTTVTIYGSSVTGTFEGHITSPLTIYNAGTWSNVTTTGITKMSGDGLVKDSSDGYIGVSVTSTGNYTILGRLNSSIGVTNYKYITVKVSDFNDTLDPTCKIGISTNSGLTTHSFSASVTVTGTGVVKIPVNNLSGDYFIYFSIQNAESGNKNYTHLVYVSSITLTID